MTSMNPPANGFPNRLAALGALTNLTPAWAALAICVVLTSLVSCSSAPAPKSGNQTSRTQGGTDQYVADQLISTKVKAALVDDSTHTGNEIQVQTFEGVVQLSGVVQSDADIDQALRITRDVDGVVMIRNDLRHP
jgi:hyperosmotically inducible protein